jgi:hypothetical protein
MRSAITQVLLLRSYPGPSSGPGRFIFRAGKSIGVVGRVLLAVFLVVVVVAAAVDERTIMLSALAAYAFVALMVLTELLSSVLMLLGSWLAARSVSHGRRAA